MAISADDAARFMNRGRDIVTTLAKTMDELNAYARVFEIRGGQGAMGDEFGNPTLEMITLHNDLVTFFDAPHQAVLDKYREDY